MARLRAELARGVVDAFWDEVTADGTPLVEPLDDDGCLVTFLWRGAACSTHTNFPHSRRGDGAVHIDPHLFGNVLAQSGSFWWPQPSEGEPEWLTRQVARLPRTPLRFALDVGRRETRCSWRADLAQLHVTRRFRDALLDRGYPVVSYLEYEGGHDYVNWRRTFADGIAALIGRH